MEINKVYIISAGKKNNGGGESLHQLADSLNRHKIIAYIFYPDEKRSDVIPEMKQYNVRLALQIEDQENNIVVCPEGFTKYIYKYKKVTKVLWFLSKDFYLRSRLLFRTHYLQNKYHLGSWSFPLVFVYSLIATDASLRTYRIETGKIKYFLFNCKYAGDYIEEVCQFRHVSMYLCAPVNEQFLNESRNKRQFVKQKLVAYNPQKALTFTNNVIQLCRARRPDIEFVAIKDLSKAEVIGILEQASVYMDFGYFPGPERLPREAALMRCNIITSDVGSAKNDFDVPIPNKYKYSPEIENLDQIYETVCDLVDNYSKRVNDYTKYRQKVCKQYDDFDRMVEFFFHSILEEKKKIKNHQ